MREVDKLNTIRRAVFGKFTSTVAVPAACMGSSQ